MAKRLIPGVDHDQGHITRLRVGNKDATGWNTRLRAEVISDIERGDEYWTYHWDGKASKYREGAQVHVVVVNSQKYLRTDKDSTAADNLGSLPTLGRCPF
jgi:hypothetical protein